jgi:hypothetical protein
MVNSAFLALLNTLKLRAEIAAAVQGSDSPAAASISHNVI